MLFCLYPFSMLSAIVQTRSCFVSYKPPRRRSAVPANLETCLISHRKWPDYYEKLGNFLKKDISEEKSFSNNLLTLHHFHY